MSSLAASWREYRDAVGSFSRPARLFLLHIVLGWAGYGVNTVLFNLYLVEGGYPIVVEEMMIGALGVGGASGGDEECGHAALEKVLGPQPPIVPPVRPSPVGPAAPPAAQRGR